MGLYDVTGAKGTKDVAGAAAGSATTAEEKEALKHAGETLEERRERVKHRGKSLATWARERDIGAMLREFLDKLSADEYKIRVASYNSWNALFRAFQGLPRSGGMDPNGSFPLGMTAAEYLSMSSKEGNDNSPNKVAKQIEDGGVKAYNAKAQPQKPTT